MWHERRDQRAIISLDMSWHVLTSLTADRRGVFVACCHYRFLRVRDNRETASQIDKFDRVVSAQLSHIDTNIQQSASREGVGIEPPDAMNRQCLRCTATQATVQGRNAEPKVEHFFFQMRYLPINRIISPGFESAHVNSKGFLFFNSFYLFFIDFIVVVFKCPWHSVANSIARGYSTLQWFWWADRTSGLWMFLDVFGRFFLAPSCDSQVSRV